MAEPFFWGAGGAKLTPEQLALAKAVLARKKSQGVDTSPVGHWTAGAARVVDALGDVFQERRLNSQQAENDQYNMSQTEPLIAALTGASAAPVVAAPVAAPMSASAPDNTAAIAAASGILPSSFLAAVDKTEGGGTYDTLYGHAQKRGPFAGTSISSMPIRDVLAFTDPNGAYAQSVKGQIGRVATPVGRYQVVGSTLKNAVGALGLDPNAPFDQTAQDNVALYLAKNRVSSANTPQGKIAALRNEWHGFKSVPDSEMLKIVSDLESAPTASRAPVASTAAQAIEQAAPSSGYVDPMVSIQPNAMAPELPAPVEVATRSLATSPVSAPVAAPQQTAPSPSAIAQALRVIADPRANDSTKAVAQALIQRQQAQEQAAQEQSVWMQRQAYQQQQQNSDPLRQAQIAQAQAQAEKLRRDAANPNGDETFYGNTVAIQNQDGSIAYGQMGNKGTFRPIQLPEGQSFAPPTRTIDAGTETVVMDQAGNVISRVPKQNRAAAAETAGGTVEGRTAAEKQIAAPADFQSAQNAMDILDQIENHPARKAGTGGTSIFNAIPGTSGYDFQNLVNQAKSGAFLTAIESMKGLGALSNAEGGAATAAVTRMDTATTEEGFMSALNDYRKIVTQGMERARRNIPEGQRPATEQQTQPQKKRLKFTATGELVE